jgi:hypothetical protein
MSNRLGILPDQRPSLYKNPEIIANQPTEKFTKAALHLLSVAKRYGFDDVIYYDINGCNTIGLTGSAKAIYSISPRYLAEGANNPFLGYRRSKEVLRIWQELHAAIGYDVPQSLDTKEFLIKLIPHPGVPEKMFYSFKHDRWYNGSPKQDYPDACQVVGGQKYSDANGPVLIRTPAGHTIAAMHSVSGADIGVIAKCGGLSWSSWAITDRISLFEVLDIAITFFADTRIMSKNLGYTSYSKSRQKAVHFAPWDNWTLRLSAYDSLMDMVMSGMSGDRVEEAFLAAEYLAVGLDTTKFEGQLRDYYLPVNKSVPAIHTWDQMDDAIYSISNKNKNKEFKTRFKGANYAEDSYAEMKVIDLIPLSDIPLAVVYADPARPKFVEQTSKKLRAAGFAGTILQSNQSPFDNPDYVSNLVREWAITNRRVEFTTPSAKSGISKERKSSVRALPAKFITLPNKLIVSDIEVTNSLYSSIMGVKIPDGFGANEPVTNVSWFMAVEFCNELTRKVNKKYNMSMKESYSINGTDVEFNRGADGFRLPTAAEWEYASDLTKYVIRNDVKDIAWFYDNADEVVQQVGQKKPNKYGLYDMLGNVSEWCWDDVKGARAVRGGDVSNREHYIPHGGIPSSFQPASKSSNIGFRVYRSEPGYVFPVTRPT